MAPQPSSMCAYGVHRPACSARSRTFRCLRSTDCWAHALQPLFFVASQNHVRVYNLVKQQLVRKLLGGAGRFTCLALHPSGDHVLAGTPSVLCF